MVLPRHSVNKSLNPKLNKERKFVKGWAGVKEDDLADFDQTIREKFKWPHTPQKFQLDAITSQLLRKDVIVHVLKHGRTELRSWIGRWNSDGMADGIETETDRCNYAG